MNKSVCFRWKYSKKRITSCNHKIIGLQYIWLSIVQGAVGTLLSMVIRLDLVNGILNNENIYNLTITLHGLIMIFFLVMPSLFSGLGNYLVPLLVSSPEMSYPRINSIALMIMPLAFLIILISMLTEYGYGTGWTIYPPLSTKSQELVLLVIGLYISGMSSVLGSINFLTTIASLKVVRDKKKNAFIWSIIVVSVLLILTIPILSSGLIMLVGDLMYSTIFYDPEFSGDPVLYQHLFWLFGHPEVYVIILPAFGVISEILCRSLLGSMAMILAMGCIGIIGSLVWGHHMNTVGLDTDTRAFYTSVTILIAIPTGTKIFNWLSSKNKSVVGVIAAAFILTFILGGTTGVVLGSGGIDVSVHDTYYVVGHFHFVLSIGAIKGVLAAIIEYWNIMIGKSTPQSMMLLRCINFTMSALIIMIPMHWLGFSSMPRRISEYDSSLMFWNILSSIGAVSSVLSLY